MNKLIAVLLLVASLCFRAEGQVTVRTSAGTTHELVFVPAGPFEMGTESGFADSKPVHTVELDAYYIDQYEVTNAQYVAYVETGGGETSMFADNNDLNNPQQAVVGVTWFDAQGYCSWAGLRLPSEAEWEKAARGTDGGTYPWGDEEATCERAVMSEGGAACGENRTWPVGAKPAGVSPYGAHDMAGNVWEWVSDWYDSKYYAASPSRNPLGGESSIARVVRGGGWMDQQFNLRASTRFRLGPVVRSREFGFRCAQTEGEVPSTSVTPQSWGEVKSDTQ